MTRKAWILALAATGLLGCASAQGARPRGMGAAAHEDGSRETEASRHRREYDAEAWSVRRFLHGFD